MKDNGFDKANTVSLTLQAQPLGLLRGGPGHAILNSSSSYFMALSKILFTDL